MSREQIRQPSENFKKLDTRQTPVRLWDEIETWRPIGEAADRVVQRLTRGSAAGTCPTPIRCYLHGCQKPKT